MPTQKTCFEGMFERIKKLKPPFDWEFYFKFKPISMKRRKMEDWLVARGEWNAESLPESSGFLWFISIILYVLFYL